MSLYTSRSEFEIEKRVQFTNEIPPYDMFGGLNSVLQTDLKLFLPCKSRDYKSVC